MLGGLQNLGKACSSRVWRDWAKRRMRREAFLGKLDGRPDKAAAARRAEPVRAKAEPRSVRRRTLLQAKGGDTAPDNRSKRA